MKRELLAPAGDIESGYAALYYGADAVYLGLQKFSARATATNFSEQNLDELVNNLAQLIIKENRQYIGADVAEQAVNEIEKEKEEGQDVGQKENGTSKRGRKKKIEQ